MPVTGQPNDWYSRTPAHLWIVKKSQGVHADGIYLYKEAKGSKFG